MAGCNSAVDRPPPREQWMSSSRWKVAENRAELAGRFGDDEDDVDGVECGALIVQQDGLVEGTSTQEEGC